MAKKGVRKVVTAVRMLNDAAAGIPEALAQAILGARQGGDPKKYQRVLKRAVTQGYLMRKNNKYYFIPSRGMNLPSLVMMRRRGRRRTRRSRRGRSRRRTAGMYLEAVMTRTSAARRRRRRSRRRHVRRRPAGPGAGVQQQVQARTSASATLQPKLEKKASASK